MRIRRNPWLPTMVAAAVFASTAAFAQDTTDTVVNAATTATDSAVSTGSTTESAAPFKLEPGDQLVYHTIGSVAMSGLGEGQDQSEDIDLTTSLTVLQKQADVLTIYASMSSAEETTAGKVQAPGPRFTFEMPVSGSDGTTEFEKAGLSGSAFPTFSIETLFAAVPAEGKTSVTLPLPITNSPVEGEANTMSEGSNLKTATIVHQDNTPVMSRESVFSKEKGATQSINTSVTLSLTARNTPVTFEIQDKTNLVSSNKLTAPQVSALTQDVELAIPVAAKLRTLDASSGDAMKAVLEQITTYLEKFPEGEFASLFGNLETQLSSVVERTSNWEKIKEGEAAPEFAATTIDNKQVKLSDYKGKVVLIDFWATWCGPCLMELPNVKKLYEASKDKGFEIIGVSADETEEDLKKLVEQENLQWPQIFDGGDESPIQEKYGVMKYPTTILLDKEGKISAVDLRGEELDKAVEELLK